MTISAQREIGVSESHILKGRQRGAGGKSFSAYLLMVLLRQAALWLAQGLNQFLGPISNCNCTARIRLSAKRRYVG